ncbi:flavodoxin [Clostridium sp. CF012]|uniref:flavodoxin family protein n=1 Tax=Clostridium sp. CF012 TaxID=2843319 RepID=UPI001C0C3CD8|nr:flavodoxin [Clostridium sp. CF012]MBU3146930.1 NAD(P)H-dependent oxidoreductase [Clostridium sp. CF012]
MKSLVVFYSLEGNTKLIANMIAKELNSEILELKPDKEIPKEGFKKFFWGGKSVVFKEKPALLNEIPCLEEYDTIFVGTPIWAGSYAPPIHTFITKSIITEKKMVFFASHSGGGAKKCFDKLKTAFANNPVIGTIDFVNPLKEDSEKVRNQVMSWLQSMF